MTIQQVETSTQKVLSFLLDNPAKQLKCTVGFDGYIDDFYRVVEKRKSKEELQYYTDIAAFGQRITMSANKSADMELVLFDQRLGGNGPILSNALSQFGLKVFTIGTLDTDRKNNPFDNMNKNCIRWSVGNSSATTTLEFNDGKIMLGNLQGNYHTWDQVKEKVGLQNLQMAYQESRLIAIVNWSGLYCIDEILKGYQEEVCSSIEPEKQKRKLFYFDLSDPSALPEKQLLKLMKRMQSYAERSRVILGLNENEAIKTAQILKCNDMELAEFARWLRAYLGAYQVVIHTNQQNFASSETEDQTFNGMHVQSPILSTGAGDHFNAGYILAVLGNLKLEEALILGQAEASYYLKNGKSPEAAELVDFIQNFTQQGERS